MNNLYELITKNARERPGKTAVYFHKNKITYAQLKEKVDGWAAFLKLKGVRPGDRAGVLLYNCPDLIYIQFALFSLGAAGVPLNIFFQEEEISYILSDSRSMLLITEKQFSKIVYSISPESGNLKEIIFTEDVSLPPPEELYTRQNTGETALILYTSGTTGRPKGVCLTHNNFLSDVRSSIEAINVGEKDCIICFLPLFHSFAWTVCVLIPLYTGGRITLIRNVKPVRKFLWAIFIRRVTVFVGIPAIYSVLIRLPGFLARIIFFWVRMCISGADALPEEILRKFELKFKVPLLEGYGLTEAGPVVSINPFKGTRKSGSVGLPLPGIEVRIADESLRDVAQGETGELLVRGGNVMNEYYMLPNATRETIVNGWLRTGDFARMDKDGYIFIVDRKKDLIITKGLNVYPKEVEIVLNEHSCVKESAVIGVRSRTGHEFVKAFVVLEEGKELSKHRLIEHCRKRLAFYKIPRLIEFTAALPKTATGKIEKKKLKELRAVEFEHIEGENG